MDYPASEYASLRARLRSDFHSTFFELFVHRLLLALGCTVDIHPEINRNRRTRPDFLATFPSGERVIIECVYPTGRTDAEKSNSTRLNVLFDEINQIRIPGFSIHLNEVSGLELRQPSTRRLRKFIRETIEALDPDELRSKLLLGGYAAMPTHTYRDREFRLEYSIWATPPETRRHAANLIGVMPSESRWGGYSGTLKSSIAQKATKYGALEHPFVVALNTGSLFGPSQQDEMYALFGNEHDVHQQAPTSTKGNGVWVGLGGPQNTRLSAVLFGQVFPWKLPVSDLRLYHNPFAARPCRDVPWQITQIILHEGKFQREEGSTVGSLLGLPSDWPGELFSRDLPTSDEGP